MRSYKLLFATLSGLVHGAPFAKGGGEPKVTIDDGTVIAKTLLGVENFKGIPFADPPVGNLRLRPAQPLSKSFGTLESELLPAACPQFWSSLDGASLPEDVAGLITNSEIFQKVTVQSEDCLTLNVQRPAGTAASAKLPVVVWIFGGAFAIGSATQYDGTRIVKQAEDLGQPVIYVAINYRLGGFGFLPGREVSKDGSSNLGLRDQRLALQWVQDNIAAFGGDPTKVTLWGESAGAISSMDHTVINGGDISYKDGQLFRGAIMNSGSTTPCVPVDHPKAQKIYDTVASAAGCTGENSLQCLRDLPFDAFSDAVAAVPSFFSYGSIDLSYMPRPDPGDGFMPESPEVAVKNGKFAKIPIINGDQADEGTLFSLTQSNISTTDDLVDYMIPVFPLATEDQIIELVDAYPDDWTAGSPFGTFFLNNIYPQFKRLAALLGDISFTLQRRAYLETVASQVPAWSYSANYLSITPVLGTFHASDVMSTFYSVPPVLTTSSILTYYISFVNHLDPNKIPNIKTWPQYDSKSKKLLQYGALSHDIITDDFREDSYRYFKENQEAFRV